MKIFQIENNICFYDATEIYQTLESTVGCYPPGVLFVEAPDYVFEGWGYLNGEFIQPTPPEGWLYDADTGAFYPKPPDKTIDDFIAEALNRIDGKCSLAIASGIDYNGKHYSLTEIKQGYLNTAYLEILGGKTQVKLAADGEDVTWHTAAQITELFALATAWGKVCIYYKGYLVAWVKAETDIAVLGTIAYGSKLPTAYMQALSSKLAEEGINLADYAGMLSNN